MGLHTKLRIDYGFNYTYGATTVSNTLTAGSTGLDNSAGAVNVADKVYNGTAVNILTVNTDANDVTFTRCLFVGCSDIVDTLDSLTATTGVTVTFSSCIFVDCTYIFRDRAAANVDLSIENSSIQDCIYINSVNTFDMDNVIYTLFVGYEDGTYTFTDCVNTRPLAIATETPIYSLMSKPRGYRVDSQGLSEINGTADCSCYTETRNRTSESLFAGNEYTYSSGVFTRSSGSTDHALTGYEYIEVDSLYYRIISFDTTTVTIEDIYDGPTSGVTITAGISVTSFEIEAVPDAYQKELILTGYESQTNINGDIIQQWNYGNEKKGVKLNYNSNWISETTLTNILTMMQEENDFVRIYPDKDDLTKWYEGKLYKNKSTSIQRQNSIFYDGDEDLVKTSGYINIPIQILISRSSGDIKE